MAGEYRSACVFVQGIRAGLLCETEDGYEFSYDKEYLALEHAVPVSITMPLTEGENKESDCRANRNP